MHFYKLTTVRPYVIYYDSVISILAAQTRYHYALTQIFHCFLPLCGKPKFKRRINKLRVEKLRATFTKWTADRDREFSIGGGQGVRMGCTLAMKSVARMIRAAIGGDGALEVSKDSWRGQPKHCTDRRRSLMINSRGLPLRSSDSHAVR